MGCVWSSWAFIFFSSSDEGQGNAKPCPSEGSRVPHALIFPLLAIQAYPFLPDPLRN